MQGMSSLLDVGAGSGSYELDTYQRITLRRQIQSFRNKKKGLKKYELNI